MNKDQIRGFTKDIAGKVQESTGRIFGNKRQQLRGLERQVEGQAQRKLGDARQVVRDAIDSH